MPQWDAVMVGAGPAGSATAAHLARAGARVLLLDRSLFPRDKPCSEYLSPGAAPLLERLGVFAEVARAVHAKLYGMKVVAPGGAVSCGRFAGRYSFALPRTTLDTILLENAARAGAVVREGVAGEGPVPGAGGGTGVGARSQSREGERLGAPGVVGRGG